MSSSRSTRQASAPRHHTRSRVGSPKSSPSSLNWSPTASCTVPSVSTYPLRPTSAEACTRASRSAAETSLAPAGSSAAARRGDDDQGQHAPPGTSGGRGHVRGRYGTAPAGRRDHPASERRASTAAARSASARETSRWVTRRTVVGPTVATRTPGLGGRGDERLRGVGVGRGTTTMLVSTAGRVDPARLGQQPGVLVVVGQALDVVVERVQPGRGQDADLAHPAAHPLAPDPRLAHRVAAARPAPSRPGHRGPSTGTPR